MRWFWNKPEYVYTDFTPADDITLQELTVIVANLAAKSPVGFINQTFDNLDPSIKRHFTKKSTNGG